ncbi:MAG: PilX N-terminal domain-containing pilus assembly protein [Gemmatimonadaceae bacterium]
MNRRGVALILVLWLLVILGGIGAGVVAASRRASGLSSNLRARVVARYAAESGIEAMRSAIEDSLAITTDSLRRRAFLNGLEPESARGDSTRLGDARFVVAVLDASARLDVNAAPEENLARLFASFTDAGRAQALARAIRQRIEGGAVASGRAEREGRPPGPSPFVNPIRALEELRALPGADDRVLQLAAPYLTVDGDGTINQSTAPAIVMRAAFGELRDAPSRLVLVSRGWLQGHPLTHEVQGVYAISNNHLVLVHWRERIL